MKLTFLIKLIEKIYLDVNSIKKKIQKNQKLFLLYGKFIKG